MNCKLQNLPITLVFVGALILSACGSTPAAIPPTAAPPAPTAAPPAPTAAPPAPTARPPATPVEQAGPVVIAGAGAGPAAIQATVDEYRRLLGMPNNEGQPGTQPSGHREINWDGLPDELAAPNTYVADFFNDTKPPRARGARL